MTPTAEQAVRAAVDALAAAILAAVRAEAAPDPGAPERLLAIPQAAEALGIGRSALYGLIGRGELRTLKVGRRRLVPAGALAAFLASRP